MSSHLYYLIVAISIPETDSADYNVAEKLSEYEIIGNLQAVVDPDLARLTRICNIDSFQPGDDFLSCITFLGCSPNIEPVTDISILHADSHVFFYGANTPAPLCPSCRREMPIQLDQLLKTGRLYCAGCESQHSPVSINWRKRAGAGSVFIAIKGAYPGEVIPNSNFSKLLPAGSATSGYYFYLQQPTMCVINEQDSI